MNDRIARITDSKLTATDLWLSVDGPTATRESRMEVVAWIAVCKFHCTLAGGFVRDWIVGNDRARPQSFDSPLQWVKFNEKNGTLSLNKALVPYDLDCILPLDRHFDIERFRDEINEFNIETKLFRSHVHYKLLLDQHAPTGPFTMDLVEPFGATRFTIPDLDVNSLYVERDQCIGIIQNIDLTNPPFLIDLKQIIENIQCKQFKVLVSIDKYLAKRIAKMVARGWTQKGEPLTDIPNKVRLKFDVNLLPLTSALYMKIEREIQQIPGFSIISVEEIHNPDVEITYESMKKLIASQCPGNNPNERFLFHGTQHDKAQKIIEEGFDYSFFRTCGLFGKFSMYFKNILL
jgi:hypothetical protein